MSITDSTGIFSTQSCKNQRIFLYEAQPTVASLFILKMNDEAGHVLVMTLVLLVSGLIPKISPSFSKMRKGRRRN